MTIPKLLSKQLLAALQSVLGEGLPVDFAPAVTPSQDLRFGDYQSNAAMMLAKQARMNPRALATEVVEKFGESEIATLEIAGPGFITRYPAARPITSAIAMGAMDCLLAYGIYSGFAKAPEVT